MKSTPKTWTGSVDGMNSIGLFGHAELSDTTVFDGGMNSDWLFLQAARLDLTVYGRAGDDFLISGSGNDTLVGGDGRDNLTGCAGNDVLFGGVGNDILTGGAGNDRIHGGAGSDTYGASGGINGAEIDLSKHISTDGQYTDHLFSIENVIGSEFADHIQGTNGINDIRGGLGDDVIRGKGGSDVLYGDSCSSSMFPGKFSGNDTFVYFKKDLAGNSVDKIMDFGTAKNDPSMNGHDKLDLTDFFKGHKGAEIDSMIHVTDTVTGSMVSMNVHGTFVNVVELVGVHGETAHSLMDEGHLMM
jgi:large repetitive protein